MHQSAFALAPAPLSPQRPEDATGFQIGWDHAQHGLVPGPELLLAGTAVGQGWRAARAVLGRRPPASTVALRQWLALRCTAWQQGADFDIDGLTPAALARLQTLHCPVRRQPLGGAPTGDDAPQAVRLNRSAGYRPGNLVILSRAAAAAAQDCSVSQALRQARAAEANGLAVQGLMDAQWRRLAVLLSFAQPLSLTEAARLPLLVLPPSGVAPRSSVQALQLLLTINFRHAGWSGRTRSLAATLPQDTQRTDFHLFVSALATRVLDAGSDARDKGQAERHVEGPAHQSPEPALSRLEAAWLHDRVLRRWQQLVLGLGDAACEELLARARALLPQPGRTPRTSGRRAAGIPPRCATARSSASTAMLTCQPAPQVAGPWAAPWPSQRRRIPPLVPQQGQP